MPEPTPTHSRDNWVAAFVAEWSRLAEDQVGAEQLREQALTLFRVVGGWPPEEAARKHFNTAPPREDRVRDPETHFAALAAEAGLIKSGDKLDANQVDFAHMVVELCAATGDEYGDAVGGYAGEHIRSLYGRD
jgi:hypothetical protein